MNSNLNEDQFSEYTFDVHEKPTGIGTRNLWARHPDVNGMKAGQIRWNDDTGEIAGVMVHSRHRRKGLATELLRRAQEVDPRVHHSTTLSEDGAAFAEATPWAEKSVDQ